MDVMPLHVMFYLISNLVAVFPCCFYLSVKQNEAGYVVTPLGEPYHRGIMSGQDCFKSSRSHSTI
jgi:hypothetical protein